jgi:hypothetical protein
MTSLLVAFGSGVAVGVLALLAVCALLMPRKEVP